MMATVTPVRASTEDSETLSHPTFSPSAFNEGIEDTPSQKANNNRFPHFCPICMLHYRRLYVTTCCSNNVCEGCGTALMQKALKMSPLFKALTEPSISLEVPNRIAGTFAQNQPMISAADMLGSLSIASLIDCSGSTQKIYGQENSYALSPAMKQKINFSQSSNPTLSADQRAQLLVNVECPFCSRRLHVVPTHRYQQESKSYRDEEVKCGTCLDDHSDDHSEYEEVEEEIEIGGSCDHTTGLSNSPLSTFTRNQTASFQSSPHQVTQVLNPESPLTDFVDSFDGSPSLKDTGLRKRLPIRTAISDREEDEEESFRLASSPTAVENRFSPSPRNPRNESLRPCEPSPSRKAQVFRRFVHSSGSECNVEGQNRTSRSTFPYSSPIAVKQLKNNAAYEIPGALTSAISSSSNVPTKVIKVAKRIKRIPSVSDQSKKPNSFPVSQNVVPQNVVLSPVKAGDDFETIKLKMMSQNSFKVHFGKQANELSKTRELHLKIEKARDEQQKENERNPPVAQANTIYRPFRQSASPPNSNALPAAAFVAPVTRPNYTLPAPPPLSANRMGTFPTFRQTESLPTARSAYPVASPRQSPNIVNTGPSAIATILSRSRVVDLSVKESPTERFRRKVEAAKNQDTEPRNDMRAHLPSLPCIATIESASVNPSGGCLEVAQNPLRLPQENSILRHHAHLKPSNPRPKDSWCPVM